MAGNAAAPKELGTERIGSLLLKYAVPGIIAMTASSLYNMVDSIFIGHIKDVGADAISAIGVSAPLMNLSTAFGTLVGVGASTIISVLLGQKNYENANKVLANILSLNTIIGLAFMAVSLTFLEPILRLFGASDATLPFAKQYMTIILIGNVITHLYFGLNNAIRSSGNPMTAMGLTLFTVISNAILDPIFIYILGMGLQGAAVATVLCQMMALCYSMRFFMDRKKFMHFPAGLFQLDWKIARQSLSIGMGPFLMNLAGCVVAIFINNQLRTYGGDLAIGAFSIVNRISFLFIMVIMGLNQGMQPIAGYNFGACQYRRVMKTFWLTAGCATVVTTLGFIVSEALPHYAVSLFVNSSDPNSMKLHDIAVHGLKVMNVAFPLVGSQIVITNLFQCLGMVRKSVFLSLSRQLLFLVPMVYALPKFFQEDGVWVSFPISDTITIITSFILLSILFSKLRKLNDGDDPSILGSNI